MNTTKNYQLRQAAGEYWLIRMDQQRFVYEKPIMLNEVGAMIWQQYMQGQTEKGIAALLQQTYGIDDQEAYQDVQQFIRQLREQGILEWSPMTEQVIQAIEAIIKRGNDVEIRRKGDGYIVLEVKKTIRYGAR